MQKVNIYINAYHTGHFKKGTGSYTIILEYMTSKNIEITKDYIEGVKGTTKNRTALIACISALSHMVKPCEIKLIINSEYVTQAINNDEWEKWLLTGMNAKGKPVKNLDLWQQLYDVAAVHEIEYEYKEKNSYTDCMYSQMKKIDIKYMEDTGNEDHM